MFVVKWPIKASSSSFRPPASPSHSSTDPRLILILTFSSLLQTGHHFLFFLLIQPRCMLGRWPPGAPCPVKPPWRVCNNGNLWDQSVWNRWCWAATEEERQRRKQGERKNRAAVRTRYISYVLLCISNVLHLKHQLCHAKETWGSIELVQPEHISLLKPHMYIHTYSPPLLVKGTGTHWTAEKELGKTRLGSRCNRKGGYDLQQ